jgi:hypothetical protein
MMDPTRFQMRERDVARDSEGVNKQCTSNHKQAANIPELPAVAHQKYV